MLTESERITRLRAFELGGVETAVTWREIKNAVQKAFNRGEKVWVWTGANTPNSGIHNRAFNEILSHVAKREWASSYPGRTPYPRMFREAVAKYQKEYFDVDYDPETDIIQTNGCGGAYVFLDFCFTKPGDVYISEEPSHIGQSYFGTMAWTISGAETKTFPIIEENEWEPDLDEMRKIPITEKTKAFTLIHPNNPVGRFHSEKSLKAIVDFAGEHSLPIISDEIYANVTLDGVKCPSIASLAKDVPVIVINSLSKFFMQPGWAVGYLAIHDPEGKIKEILRTGTKHSRFLKVITPIVGAAAIGLLSCSRDKEGILPDSVMHYTSMLMKRLHKNTDYILKRIEEIDGLSVVRPNSTFYMFPKIEGIGKTWKSEREFLVQLAEEENVALYGGIQYGPHGKGHYRSIGFYPTEEYEEVYDRIERFIKRHTK
jgi:aspartate/methionine/tyrosine aminotransferase